MCKCLTQNNALEIYRDTISCKKRKKKAKEKKKENCKLLNIVIFIVANLFPQSKDPEEVSAPLILWY